MLGWLKIKMDFLIQELRVGVQPLTPLFIISWVLLDLYLYFLKSQHLYANKSAIYVFFFQFEIANSNYSARYTKLMDLKQFFLNQVNIIQKKPLYYRKYTKT